MSPRRTLTAVQLGTAAVVVLVLALTGGGQYPLWVDLAVYAAGAAMTATAVAQLHQAAADRRKRRHSDNGPGPRPVPYTVWALAAVAVAWIPWLIGPGGEARLQRWAPYALASIVLALAVGALADLARRRRTAPGPADRPEDVTRDQALTEAADWVITGRPAEDHHGRTLTPAMVQREALMRSGLEVSHTDAAFALDSRLHFRGYGPDPAHRSFAWEYGDLRESDDGPTSPGRM